MWHIPVLAASSRLPSLSVELEPSCCLRMFSVPPGQANYAHDHYSDNKKPVSDPLKLILYIHIVQTEETVSSVNQGHVTYM